MNGPITGKGSLDQPLRHEELYGICASALSSLRLSRKRVLALIPDQTRHAQIGLFFRLVNEVLGPEVETLDFLIATGTHAAMEPERIYRHLGITQEEHREKFPKVRFFNHDHADVDGLAAIGVITGEELSKLTGGIFSTPIGVTVNKKVLEYDHVLLITPVVPHEAMGFAGGNKYFFPGVAGLEVVETFHWLAALITNPAVNGVKDTPTRRVIDRAAEFIPTPSTCLAYAVDDHDRPMCLFVGDAKEAWSRAADYSARLHITYVEKPFRRILAVTPDIYEDLWVGGKAMYKLEPIVEEGGELIIYGPQIRAFSFTHEREIRRIGYHVIEYFTKQWPRFANEPKLVMAHSTNVRGIGTFQNEVECPRIGVTLATSIPEDVCRSANLGYLDYRSVDREAWRKKEDEETLLVENAGQVLYRLRGAAVPAVLS